MRVCRSHGPLDLTPSPTLLHSPQHLVPQPTPPTSPTSSIHSPLSSTPSLPLRIAHSLSDTPYPPPPPAYPHPFPASATLSTPPSPLPAQWLTKETAATHTLTEIVQQCHCTEQGAKNMMSRRGIAECKVRGPRDPPPTTPSESARRWESLFGVSTFFNLRF